MIDLKEILENSENVKKNLINRGVSPAIIDEVISLAKRRNEYIFLVESLRERRNKASKLAPNKSENDSRSSALFAEVRDIKKKIEKYEFLMANTANALRDLVLKIPNMLDKTVPVGKDENENVVLEEFVDLGKGLVKSRTHHSEIVEQLNLVYSKVSSKLCGSRFVIYNSKLSRLIRSLCNYMIDFNQSRGYQEIGVPHLIKGDMLLGTGQLPKFKEDLFKIKDLDLWLIPTGEVPLTNIFHNEIINLENPYSFTTYTKCFRSEAGSGGKDIRGIVRLKEFHKVELVKISSQEDAEQEYEKMVSDVTALLKSFNIPFRKVLLCSGDIGFSASKTIDFEIWIPSENKYREISSVSACSTFQSRRAKIRYKSGSKIKYAVTMNGSALAVDRLVAAIIENNRSSDNTINIPECLVPYYKSKTL